jgi:hypothetical protein
MNQSAPDSKVLGNYGSIEFNQELLKSPREIELNSFLLETARKDPELLMLSPLSRLLFYRNSPEIREYLNAALASTHVALYEFRDMRPGFESVHFETERMLDDRRYVLRFKSLANFIWAGEDDNEGLADQPTLSFPLLSVANKFSQLPAVTKPILGDFLGRYIDQQLAERDSNSGPIGYITDDGEFVCSIVHRLISVNGTALNPAPLISDSVHYSYIESADPEIPIQEINRDEEFSWASLLSSEARLTLDIADDRDCSSVSLSADQREQYLSANQLDLLYQRGKPESANRQEPSTLSILFGAGSSWNPECEQEDYQDEGSEKFPEDCPPTHELDISSMNNISGQDDILLCILELLSEAIRRGGSD